MLTQIATSETLRLLPLQEWAASPARGRTTGLPPNSSGASSYQASYPLGRTAGTVPSHVIVLPRIGHRCSSQGATLSLNNQWVAYPLSNSKLMARGCGKTGSLLGSYLWLARGLAFTWVFVLPIDQCGAFRVAEGRSSPYVSAL